MIPRGKKEKEKGDEIDCRKFQVMVKLNTNCS